MFVLFIIACKFCVNAFETITLTPSQLESNDGSIAINLTENYVTTINNTWHVNPTNQTGTDMIINLDNEYKFHQFIQSTINITIDGFTPSNKTLSDGEFLILFAVDDTQYFSVTILLQNSPQAWKSYPSYNNQPLATTNSIYNDIIAKNSPDRWHRVSNFDSWVNIGSVFYKKRLIWPLNIQITNDPINNKVYYKCYLSDKTLSITYQSSFDTNKPMKIYIMNDASDNKPFDIYSIDLSYHHNTETPTSVSTNIPNNVPTIKPTNNPTTPSLKIVNKLSTLSPTTREELNTTTVIKNISKSPNKKSVDLMTYLIIGQVVLICLLCCICGIVMRIAIKKFKSKKEKEPSNIPKPKSEIHCQLSNAIHSNVVQLDIVKESKQESSSSHNECMYSTVGISTEEQTLTPTGDYSDEKQQCEGMETNELLDP